MAIYLVKHTSIATDENSNFAGKVAITYNGIGDRILACYGSYFEATHNTRELTPYMVETFGYLRECDAKRNWTYKNPENTKWWKSTVEIVDVSELLKKGKGM